MLDTKMIIGSSFSSSDLLATQPKSIPTPAENIGGITQKIRADQLVLPPGPAI